MERDKDGKLKNDPIISVEESDYLEKQLLDDSKSRKMHGIEL